MSSPGEGPGAKAQPTSRRHVIGHRKAAALLLAFAAAAALALAMRDLPRRWVEGVLAETLAAEVDLGSFAIGGPHSFALGGIRVVEPAIWPGIRTIRVDSLGVEAGIRSALRGRYRELVLDGLEVEIAPIPSAASPPTEAAPAIEADLVEVRRARVVLDDGGHRIDCSLRAVLEELGRTVKGRLRIGCPRLASTPFLSFLETRAAGEAATTGPAAVRSAALDLELDGLTADLVIGPRANSLRARASAAGSRLSVDGRVRELGPLAARLFDEPGGPLLVAEISAAAIADAIRLEAWLDDASLQWRRAAASLRRLRLGAVQELLPPPYSEWKAEGVADFDLVAEPRTGAAVTAVVTLSRLARSGVEQPVRGTEMRVEANLAPPKEEPRATVRVSASVSGGADRGTSRPLPTGLLPLAVELAAGWHEAEDRLSIDRLVLETGRLGRLAASGSLRSPLAEPELLADWSWNGASIGLVLAAAGTAAESTLQGSTLRGSVSGRGRLQGALASPEATGAFHFDGLELAAAPAAGSEASAPAPPLWSLRAEHFETAWAWTGARTPIRVSAGPAAAVLGLAELPDLDLEISGRGRLEPAFSAVQLETLDVRAAELGRGSLSGRISPTAETELRLRWAEADLPAWLAYAAPQWKGPWRDLSLRGTATVDGEVTRAAPGPWRSRSSLTLAGGGFEAAGGARVVDGLQVTSELAATLTANGSADVRSSIRAGGFQLLWGTLFADYSTTHVDLEVSLLGRRQPDGAGWDWDGSALSQLAGDSTISARASLRPQRPLELGLDLEIGELGGFLTDYVQAPLASGELLAGLQASGALTANLSASVGDATRTLAGRIIAKGLDCRTESDGFGVRGFDLDLPADLVWSQDEASGTTVIEGPPLPGRLGFAELSAAGISIDETSTTFLVEGDSAALDTSLTVPLLGGRIRLDRLTLAELLRPGRSLMAALRLEDIQLDEVSRALDLFPLEGQASGEFPRVRLRGDTLQVDGGGRVSVFGGEVALGSISGSKIFSDYPRLGLSAEFRDIDLERLTHRLDFGEMTGTVEGRVSDLELFHGTPVRFRARLASVHRPGRPQTISLKAIDNIALLGGGGGVGVLNQGIQRFFDRYRYRELGLAMVLDDDHFLIRGLARRGGHELFIKGRPPIRLDMVNVKPGRTVSFRTMMERLRNLEVSREPPQRLAAQAEARPQLPGDRPRSLE